MMDMTVNIFRDRLGKRILRPMFNLTEEVHKWMVIGIGAKNITIDGIGRVEPYYAGFLALQKTRLFEMDPEIFIVERIKTEKIFRNIDNTGQDPDGTSASNIKEKLQHTTDNMRSLLNSTNREEDIQLFLQKNPAILYPEFIRKYNKLRLADDYVTDFIFVNHGYFGEEHVFVEIESASKKIFTKGGVLSADYTQAKDQLLNWQIWIEKNQRFLSDKVGSVRVPIFHLIMGRSAELDEDRRWKLKKDSANSCIRFSTYDDILARFERTVAALVQP